MLRTKERVRACVCVCVYKQGQWDQFKDAVAYRMATVLKTALGEQPVPPPQIHHAGPPNSLPKPVSAGVQ